MAWYIWLIMAGVFLIAEIITVGFLIFWLAIGSLFAMITSFFIDNILIQTTVFVVSSTILIFATKPFVKKFVTNKNPIKTNVYSIIDKTGIVTKDVVPDEPVGQVKVEGETWSAISDIGEPIEKGTKVKILKIKGVKALVKPIDSNQ